jgi:hypothetical protein
VLAFYAVKHAYDENLGGIGELINDWVRAAKLAWGALVQVFTDGGFSGAIKDELDWGKNQGLKNFVVGIFLAFNRIKNFFAGMSDSFSSAITAMAPTFAAFKDAIDGLSDAFSSLYETNDPADATSKFEAFGSAGAAVGKVLASVAGAVVKIFTAGVQLVTGFINNFGKIKTAVQPILDLFGEIVTEIFSAGSAFSTAGGGFTSVGAGIASVVAFILTIVAQLVPVIRAIVKAAGQQLRGIVTALSGVIDIVAGILSGDWGRVWTGAKKIVFAVLNNIISGVLGLVAAVAASMDKIAGFMGKESHLSQTIQDWSAGISSSLIGPGTAVGTAQAGVADAVANASIPGPNASTPSVSAPPMSLGVGPLQAFVETDGIASAVASGMKSAPAPVTNVKVTLDGADLMSKMETESRSSAGASFTPGIPVVG